MNFYKLRSKIQGNNYEEIVEYIDREGGPDCCREFRCAAQIAVETTRNGREGHSVRALMDRGFSFVSIDYGFRGRMPLCALTDLWKFASCAQSRKQEALSLLHDVYEYEIPRTEHVPEQIIPITHPDMAVLKRKIDLVLAMHHRLLPKNKRLLRS